MMLREGWDVQSVTVIVGLRPYTSQANILPEQTVGRGLRLMFRGATGYIERVDVIGNNVHRVRRAAGTRRRHPARDIQDRREGEHHHHRA
ncbi:MAG: hypothetical protein WCC90_09340 [Methylocella sp.]